MERESDSMRIRPTCQSNVDDSLGICGSGAGCLQSGRRQRREPGARAAS
jgi:hypothetical protein